MEGFIGQIMLFAGNFAPRAWAFCEGQLLPISQNTALFSILGTTYGGDGRTTFALPDFRGRVVLHPGNGPGLSPKRLGEKGGHETVTLFTQNLPAHHHIVNVKGSSVEGEEDSPTGNVTGETEIYATPANLVNMPTSTSGKTGDGLAHNNMQPFLGLNYVICLNGTFPSRS